MKRLLVPQILPFDVLEVLLEDHAYALLAGLLANFASFTCHRVTWLLAKMSVAKRT
ncbi:TPA: hypothetical protein ACHTCR_005152 [Pseudomonas putida]